MKSLYSDVPEVPDSEYLFEEGILTVICKEGVGRIILDTQYDEPISLEDIVQRYPEVDMLIHEDMFSGEVFDYNRYGDGGWFLIGKTRGYA
jgi:hypothetical protein